ncbi:MAG: ABC transporter ATP-binding protein [Alphaproteobacteria bacterium]|nr:ABC transporter ATP-binding protein [Alphaproteobacteria bacterium]
MNASLLLGDLHALGHSAAGFADGVYPIWVHVVMHLVMFGAPAALVMLIVLKLVGWLKAGVAGRLSAFGRPPRRGAMALDPSIFRFVARASWRRQIALVLWAAASLPVLYLTLELPKLIINNALESGHFPIRLLGWEIGQIGFLALLCLGFLAAIAVNGALKYTVNVKTGQVAEAISRRLRLIIYRRWRQQGRPGGAPHLIPVALQEVEPVGGFAGESLVLPVFQGGAFATIILFMLVQDPILGAAALSLLPVQMLVIPRLQRRINLLARERVREARRFGGVAALADAAGATAGGAKAGGAKAGGSRRVLGEVFGSFRRLQQIRYRLHERKFFMKSLNNFIGQMTPFFFYTIGGVLVIEGRLTLGALVAVLTAYKDLSAPLKELFRYYQTQADVVVRYEEIRRFLGLAPPPGGLQAGAAQAGGARRAADAVQSVEAAE